MIWPSALAPHLVNLKPSVPDDVLAQHLPAIIKNNTIDGKLVAMPWYTDAGLLYYRKDLLEKHGLPVPATYGELVAEALTVQEAERAGGAHDLWGLVFEGNAYEGLTCNALEWVDAYGGAILADNGQIAIDSPRAALALAQAASWVGTIRTAARHPFHRGGCTDHFPAGNAVFMRNWPYAWALLNAANSQVKGKVGVAPLPSGSAGGKHSAVLGGWQLAVSRYSKAQDAAIDLVKYLTSPPSRSAAPSPAPTRPRSRRSTTIRRCWRPTHSSPTSAARSKALSLALPAARDRAIRSSRRCSGRPPTPP